MVKEYPDIPKMEMFAFTEKEQDLINRAQKPDEMKQYFFAQKMNRMFSALANPSTEMPAVKPEEVGFFEGAWQSIFGKAEGGSIPTSLRNAGVTSIRKI